MNHVPDGRSRAHGPSVALGSKIAFGVILPTAAFAVGQAALVGSTSGTGSWAGMSVFFAALFAVPALAVANCWVLPVCWRRRMTLILAGLALPVLLFAIEYQWYAWLQHGAFTKPLQWLLAEREFPADFVPVLAIVFYAPLLATAAAAIGRRMRSRADHRTRSRTRDGA